ncbi:MAG: hypothetical protein R3B90_02920 [Planctomycetaceae bacterium]
MQIFVGNDAVTQSFELPEEVVPTEEVPIEGEMQELESNVRGDALWQTLKGIL